MEDRRMAVKAISQRTAEYLGYAPAVAGGYVAVNGPRIERIEGSWYREMKGDAEDPDTPIERREEIKQQLEQYHRLPQSGDYARIAPQGYGGDLVLVVPADHPIAQHGYALPTSLIAELIPHLEAAGYEAIGLGKTTV